MRGGGHEPDREGQSPRPGMPITGFWSRSSPGGRVVSTWILLFVALDLIVVMVVAWFVVIHRRHRPRGNGAETGDIRRFADSVQKQIGDYVRARYAGDPETLAPVLPELIARIHSQAHAAGLELRRDVLEALITRAIVAQDIARERDVARAFEDLRPEAML
jgi:hypothetical protein